MRKELPLPQEVWDRTPPDIQAAIWVLVDTYERRIAALEAEGAELKERRTQNSSNSSRPPSSDPAAVKRTPPRAPSGRKRGAQPGPAVYQRSLVPVEQGQAVIACKPRQCRRCGSALPGSDPQPWRHQVLEVPPPTPEVTEYQLPRLVGARWGISPCGTLPPAVPATSYGPRLASGVALGTGA